MKIFSKREIIKTYIRTVLEMYKNDYDYDGDYDGYCDCEWELGLGALVPELRITRLICMFTYIGLCWKWNTHVYMATVGLFRYLHMYT